MAKISYINGDLIKLAQYGEFDVIVHGCNCFCTQGAGVAKQMNAAFDTLNPHRYSLEAPLYKGDMNKLGQIQDWIHPVIGYKIFERNVTVVNAYTQYLYDLKTKPFDYDAYTLCMRKLNHKFAGKTIGMPKIGSHLAGGDWDKIEEITNEVLTDVEPIVVNYVLQRT